MIPSSSHINQAMYDVRKAYRLLHDYQKMVLDAVAYVGAQLGLTYAGGWPKFSDASPRNGSGQLSHSAWNWLNMLMYEFHFKQTQADGCEIWFSILLISDSGYFFGESDEGPKQTLSSYLSPEKSKSCVGFFISKKPETWIGPVESQKDVRAFIETGGTLPQEYAEAGILGACYDIDRLMSEDETNRLISDLISAATAHGIPLQRIKMTE